MDFIYKTIGFEVLPFGSTNSFVKICILPSEISLSILIQKCRPQRKKLGKPWIPVQVITKNCIKI